METKNTTKISLPPRAVCVLKLKQAAKAPALRVPRGVDVSPLVVVKPVRQLVSGSVGQPEQAGSLTHELAGRIVKLEAEIAELKKQRAGVPALPSASGIATVIEQLACERVARELAAMVTAETPKPQVKRRWWQWW